MDFDLAVLDGGAPLNSVPLDRIREPPGLRDKASTLTIIMGIAIVGYGVWMTVKPDLHPRWFEQRRGAIIPMQSPRSSLSAHVLAMKIITILVGLFLVLSAV